MDQNYDAERMAQLQRRRQLRQKRRKQRQLRQALVLGAAALLLITLLIVFGLTLKSCLSETPAETEPSTQPSETEPAGPYVVSTATIGSLGDLLMHKPVFDATKYTSAVQQADGTYDFTCVFEHLAPYTSGMDYAVANLETTFGGTQFPYQGNPSFNCPDSLMDSLVDCGFDMLLTANNHCADTLMTGIDRTLNTVRDYDVQTLGTRLSADEKRYTVEEINGIRVGMVCYTYTLSMVDGKPNLNGNTPVAKPEQVNFFDYNDLGTFYTQVEQIMADMASDGAEATVFYIHWGTEYQLEENEQQRRIAQKLCDLGVDVIVGGHPHVIQPIKLLESTTDSEHKTVCVYSLGNVVSNQRLGNLNAISTAHTEDGMIFTVTFEKYSDGNVYVSAVDVIPTWVTMFNNENGRTVYAILPLDASVRGQWAQRYSLTENTLNAAGNSYDRTMEIVGAGLDECRDYLTNQKNARDAANMN
jgi:poly-gamma-glutamate synthesis protein (capsule biosynthesis protein)